ncbi:MAG TPA: transglycosylase SLT domain-containing protein [Candidatus Saccharimonadales bacterium]|nr:transglycosylase SLT domain-containing protein [Candidatus Saccharimonadales bacterium]
MKPQEVTHLTTKMVAVKHLEPLPEPQLPALATAAKLPEPVQPIASSGSDIETIVRHAARKYGIDEDYFVHIATCESRLTPTAVNYSYNENGYPSGIFQHISGYWPARAAKYGYAGASVFDAEANANVTAAMFADGLQGLWECK